MLPLANFHQHSTYCDGHDTLKEVVQQAISKGFQAIGFSSHAPLILPQASSQFSLKWLMAMENFPQYLHDIHTLRDEYAGQIEIYTGLEADYFDAQYNPSFWQPYQLDYCIGSVHLIPSQYDAMGYLPVDSAGKWLQLLLSEYGGGEGIYRICLSQTQKLIESQSVDIIAHLDLYNKCNQDDSLFDRQSTAYLDAVAQVFASAVQHDVMIEINTGYMARKGFAEPFPNYALIQLGASMGVKFCINSDCHRKKDIDYAFDVVVDKIKTLGVKQLYSLHQHQWQPWEV